jgi:hypothetical protein
LAGHAPQLLNWRGDEHLTINMSITYLELIPTAIATHQLRGGTNAAIRERIRNARIIFGLDSDAMKVNILFGRALIKDIVDDKQGSIKERDIVSIIYDENDHDDLEIACAAVRITKGEHEYVRGVNAELPDILVVAT